MRRCLDTLYSDIRSRCAMVLTPSRFFSRKRMMRKRFISLSAFKTDMRFTPVTPPRPPQMPAVRQGLLHSCWVRFPDGNQPDLIFVGPAFRENLATSKDVQHRVPAQCAAPPRLDNRYDLVGGETPRAVIRVQLDDDILVAQVIWSGLRFLRRRGQFGQPLRLSFPFSGCMKRR